MAERTTKEILLNDMICATLDIQGFSFRLPERFDQDSLPAGVSCFEFKEESRICFVVRELSIIGEDFKIHKSYSVESESFLQTALFRKVKHHFEYQRNNIHGLDFVSGDNTSRLSEKITHDIFNLWELVASVKQPYFAVKNLFADRFCAKAGIQYVDLDKTDGTFRVPSLTELDVVYNYSLCEAHCRNLPWQGRGVSLRCAKRKACHLFKWLKEQTQNGTL